MRRVRVDDSLRSKLEELHSQTELCDRNGTLLGQYFPAVERPGDLRRWIASQISDEELERRVREPGGLTTEEVLEKLRSLETKQP